MIHIILALLLQSPTQGWTDELLCFDPAVYADPCDVRCHVHLEDIGIPGQGAADLGPFPQFGEIGSSVTIRVHRIRYLTMGAFITQGSAALVTASSAPLCPAPYVPGLGWAWPDPTQHITSWMGVADSKGVASVTFGIPDDPDLIGVALYIQALVDDDGTLRESSGGRLELWG